MSRQGQTIMYARGGRRRKLLNVDLNDPPPSDHEELIPFTIVNVIEDPIPPVQEDNLPTVPVAPVTQGFQPLGSTPPVPINVEELDDDVIISTHTAFEEARNGSRRLQARTSVVNVESEMPAGASHIPGPNRRNRRKRYHPMHFVINLEGSSNSMKEPVAPPPPPPSPPPPSPPRPPTFNCPVCMGPLVEEVTTKCGHIFCKSCIKTAIAAMPKCPTCRRRVTNKDIIRIYLPAAS